MKKTISLFVLAVAVGSAAPVRFKLASLEVESANSVLTGRWAIERILVTGRLADGKVRDVTSSARFKSSNAKIAKVSQTGVVTPVADGAVTISVSVPGAKKKASVSVTVRNSRDQSASFVTEVRSVVSKLGCNSTACHGAQRGKGGFRLSLFGGDANADFEAITKDARGRRINRVEPMKSLFLLKATASVNHAGGRKLEAGTPEYEQVVAWLVRGAPWSDDKEPQIVSLKVFPAERTLEKGESQQLFVKAIFSDGSQKDVTPDAVYQSSDAKIASVAATGKLQAQGYGESAIVVNYLRQSAVWRAVIPQPLSKPFPALEANNHIDELVYAKLQSLGIPPSPLCTDPEFLRRAYLDVIGILPTAQEARQFLAAPDPRKRAKLIDQLLERDEFADFWSLKWGDLLRIKSEYPVRVWPKAVAVYYRWVHDSIARNKPYDQFVKELLTASGSNFRSGPTNFFRAVPSKDARTLGESAALVFMGARVGCAHCHGHPTERWTLDDDLGLGAFFAKVNFKNTMEWKEEIVFPDPKGNLRDPRTREIVKPAFPGLAPNRDGVGADDPREQFAAWLIDPQNPWFKQNIVNRIWYWLLGRGIVNEPDDLRATNPPENPGLLDYLAQELIGHRYDLKHIYRLILNSRTYQRSSRPNAENSGDAAHFSHYLVKRLAAEQLLDAISQVTETSEKFRSIIPEPFSNWPQGYRATQISDGNTECSFLDMFGRPPRDTPYEEERNSDVSLRQALYFINSEQLDGKVTGSPSIKRLLAALKDDAGMIEELYLTMLSRYPTREEKSKLLDYLAKKKTARGPAVQDVVWAIMNAKEFLFNH